MHILDERSSEEFSVTVVEHCLLVCAELCFVKLRDSTDHEHACHPEHMLVSVQPGCWYSHGPACHAR
jgi:hypothetical protein